MGELLARADPPDPEELLAKAGWRCKGHAVQELCAMYGRTLSLNPSYQYEPAQQPTQDPSRGGFVTAWLP
jgi:hypothetical protein